VRNGVPWRSFTVVEAIRFDMSLHAPATGNHQMSHSMREQELQDLRYATPSWEKNEKNKELIN
jgi:hypothetical protein